MITKEQAKKLQSAIDDLLETCAEKYSHPYSTRELDRNYTEALTKVEDMILSLTEIVTDTGTSDSAPPRR